MPYIAREDGEHFVIPSYRDVLSVKKGSLLKREILLLSEDYGGYITLQRKNAQQYEVAFSPDLGYLLGETVWHYYKRPFDLIYCEAIPNTADAILVIVKSGSVYLDGRFPLDSIPEELLVFLTQKNHFDIYVYGDVPLVSVPEAGKFAFDPVHVRSFTVLDEPAFPKLPKVRAFQLRLVDTVLRAHDIGVFPIKKILAVLVLLGLVWMGWNYLKEHKKELPQTLVGVVDPYQFYINLLASPAPSLEVKKLCDQVMLLFTAPGWVPSDLEYRKGVLQVKMLSLGTDTHVLMDWANRNAYQLTIDSSGISIGTTVPLTNRYAYRTINRLDDVIAGLIDRLAIVLPGNNLKVGAFQSKGIYKQVDLTINFSEITANTLDLIGEQLNGLPLLLSGVSIAFSNGYLTGKISLIALGN